MRTAMHVGFDTPSTYKVRRTTTYPHIRAGRAHQPVPIISTTSRNRASPSSQVQRAGKLRAVTERISLGTDAHHAWQLEFIDLGLAAALRAKIAADRILNFMPILELKAWAKSVRDRITFRR